MYGWWRIRYGLTSFSVTALRFTIRVLFIIDDVLVLFLFYNSLCNPFRSCPSREAILADEVHKIREYENQSVARRRGSNINTAHWRIHLNYADTYVRI